MPHKRTCTLKKETCIYLGDTSTACFIENTKVVFFLCDLYNYTFPMLLQGAHPQPSLQGSTAWKWRAPCQMFIASKLSWTSIDQPQNGSHCTVHVCAWLNDCGLKSTLQLYVALDFNHVDVLHVLWHVWSFLCISNSLFLSFWILPLPTSHAPTWFVLVLHFVWLCLG